LWSGWNGDPITLDVRAWEGQFWRPASATLLHLDILHLGFNLVWLWVLGTTVERVLRPVPTAGAILLFAVGSAAAQYAFAGPGVGLSGVVYGLFGLLVVLNRWDTRFAGAMDRRTVNLFVVWFLFCCVMTWTGNWRVGNMAHASGTALGLLLGLAITARGTQRVCAISALSIAFVAALFFGVLATPAPDELAYVGYCDLENGRNEAAAAKFERAVESDPSHPDWWYNLGLARHRLGQPEVAVEAYSRGLALTPQDRDLREGLLAAKAEWAYYRHTSGDFEGAVVLYKEVLAEDESQALIWYNLGLAYQEQGRTEPAKEALARAVDLDPAREEFRRALLELPMLPDGPE
jgi:GlpG protein